MSIEKFYLIVLAIAAILFICSFIQIESDRPHSRSQQEIDSIGNFVKGKP